MIGKLLFNFIINYIENSLKLNLNHKKNAVLNKILIIFCKK